MTPPAVDQFTVVTWCRLGWCQLTLQQHTLAEDFGAVICSGPDYKVGSPCQAERKSHFSSLTVAADRFLLGGCRVVVEGAHGVAEVLRREPLVEISPRVWLGLPQGGASPLQAYRTALFSGHSSSRRRRASQPRARRSRPSSRAVTEGRLDERITSSTGGGRRTCVGRSRGGKPLPDPGFSRTRGTGRGT
jgi:hypothetical protein